MFSIYFATNNYIPENKGTDGISVGRFLQGVTHGERSPLLLPLYELKLGTYTLWGAFVQSEEVQAVPSAWKSVVKPPFYASNWAFLLYALIVGGIVYYLMRDVSEPCKTTGVTDL